MPTPPEDEPIHGDAGDGAPDRAHGGARSTIWSRAISYCLIPALIQATDPSRTVSGPRRPVPGAAFLPPNPPLPPEPPRRLQPRSPVNPCPRTSVPWHIRSGSGREDPSCPRNYLSQNISSPRTLVLRLHGVCAATIAPGPEQLVRFPHFILSPSVSIRCSAMTVLPGLFRPSAQAPWRAVLLPIRPGSSPIRAP